jgi:hypothetical protein
MHGHGRDALALFQLPAIYRFAVDDLDAAVADANAAHLFPGRSSWFTL